MDRKEYRVGMRVDEAAGRWVDLLGDVRPGSTSGWVPCRDIPWIESNLEEKKNVLTRAWCRPFFCTYAHTQPSDAARPPAAWPGTAVPCVATRGREYILLQVGRRWIPHWPFHSQRTLTLPSPSSAPQVLMATANGRRLGWPTRTEPADDNVLRYIPTSFPVV